MRLKWIEIYKSLRKAKHFMRNVDNSIYLINNK